MTKIKALLDRSKANEEGRYDEFVVIGIADENGKDLTSLLQSNRPTYPSMSMFEEDLVKMTGGPVEVEEITAS